MHGHEKPRKDEGAMTAGWRIFTDAFFDFLPLLKGNVQLMKNFWIKWLLHYISSKGAVLVFALIYAFLAVTGSTFSWITSSDTVVNEVEQDGVFSTVIEEEFSPLADWKSGTKAAKTVTAYNSGTMDAVVRISFEEVLTGTIPAATDTLVPYPIPDVPNTYPATVPVEQYSDWPLASAIFTVNLPIGTPSGLVVKAKPSALAEEYHFAVYQELSGGNTQQVTADFSVNGTTLTVSNLQYWAHSNVDSVNAAAAWGKALITAATPTPPISGDIGHLALHYGGNPVGEYFLIHYTNMITSFTSPSADAGKWFYNDEDGFFYYLGKLPSGSFSESLMDGLTLSTGMTAAHLGLHLNFVVNLEGQQNRAEALEDHWGLDPDGTLYSRLAAYCS
ncbi:MAG: hypothetical protein LBJ11_10665 [Oscillospiraceae bacterium]|jgi:hypothetical protein|nr:hypothetical protein [Oscillospiraceae bacterium]